MSGQYRIEWAARVDEPHPMASEKPGDIVPCGSQTEAREACADWHGWTLVYRHVTAWREPKPVREPVLARGKCPACAREIVINGDGLLRNHDEPKARGQRWAGRCAGSHKRPVEVLS